MSTQQVSLLDIATQFELGPNIFVNNRPFIYEFNQDYSKVVLSKYKDYGWMMFSNLLCVTKNGDMYPANPKSISLLLDDGKPNIFFESVAAGCAAYIWFKKQIEDEWIRVCKLSGIDLSTADSRIKYMKDHSELPYKAEWVESVRKLKLTTNGKEYDNLVAFIEKQKTIPVGPITNKKKRK